MKSRVMLTIAGAACFGTIVVMGQGQGQAPGAPAAAAPPQQGPGVQAPSDARYRDWVMTKCKNPPAAAAPRGGGNRGPATRPEHVAYEVKEIPGVVAAGAQWKSIWTGTGNNADGIIATKDGGILAAQNTDSKVMKIDKDGKVSFPYTDTNTGGSVSENNKGVLFVAERALPAGVWTLAPQKKVFADMYNGEPLDCLGGVLNDLFADQKGGVYFTMGGLYYADSKGVVTKQGTVSGTNGLALSPDEKTMYVTGRMGGAAAATPAAAGPAPGAAAGAAGAAGAGARGRGGMVAFDVKSDGQLTNERTFSSVGGDGTTVDSQGRVYSTGGAGVQVMDKDGKFLGEIPAPLPLITVVFSGPDKKTLYGVANNQQFDEIFTLPMIAQGYKDRGK